MKSFFKQFFCKHNKLNWSFIHVFNREDQILIYCDKCHKELFNISLLDVYNKKNCYCCYCKEELENIGNK